MRAPFVVLGLRGNGGGSSEAGRQIAISLVGASTVEARLGPTMQTDRGGLDGTRRVSEGNISNLEFLLQSDLPGGPEARKIIEDELRAVRAARTQDFSGSLAYPIASSKPGDDIPGRC